MTIKQLKENINQLKGMSKLHKRVINDIISDSKDYDGNFIEKLRARCECVNEGCANGMVSNLIYYKDTVPFFKKYIVEIGYLLNDLRENIGMTIYELKDFDREDIFCRTIHNQNQLAWFGYEEVSMQLLEVIEEFDHDVIC